MNTLSTPAPSKPRFHSLDLIKGVAILLVICFHVRPLSVDLTADNDLSMYWFGWTEYCARLAVSIFFVISGFSIHISLLQKKILNPNFQPRWINFFRHRLQQLYPAYILAIFLSLTVSGIWGWFSKHDPFKYLPSTWDFLSHLLLLHSLSPETFFGIIPALWFMGTLVQLYLLYPLFWKWSQHGGINKALFLIGVLTIASRLASHFLTLDTNETVVKMTLWSYAPQRWFEWCWGAWIAHQVSHKISLPWQTSWFYVLLIVLWLPLGYQFRLFYEPILGTLVGLSLWSLIEHEYENYPKFDRNGWKILIFLGKLSYPIYLLHQIFTPYLRSLLTKFVFLSTFESSLLLFIGILIITSPLALLLNRLVVYFSKL